MTPKKTEPGRTVIWAHRDGNVVTLSTIAFGEEWTLEYSEAGVLPGSPRERLQLEKSIALITETLRRN